MTKWSENGYTNYGVGVDVMVGEGEGVEVGVFEGAGVRVIVGAGVTVLVGPGVWEGVVEGVVVRKVVGLEVGFLVGVLVGRMVGSGVSVGSGVGEMTTMGEIVGLSLTAGWFFWYTTRFKIKLTIMIRPTVKMMGKLGERTILVKVKFMGIV
jgi:hypothetical protein